MRGSGPWGRPTQWCQQGFDRVSLLLPEFWGPRLVPRLHTSVLMLAPDPRLSPVMASLLVLPSQGCYTVILNTFETYVYLAGALAIGVLAIEVSKSSPFLWLPKSKAHTGSQGDPP